MDKLQVGEWVLGRFAPLRVMRSAQVVGVDGDAVLVETMDGGRHWRRRWSLRRPPGLATRGDHR
jgi:hypothetical protein